MYGLVGIAAVYGIASARLGAGRAHPPCRSSAETPHVARDGGRGRARPDDTNRSADAGRLTKEAADEIVAHADHRGARPALAVEGATADRGRAPTGRPDDGREEHRSDRGCGGEVQDARLAAQPDSARLDARRKGQYTVFAPTDAAFAKVPKANRAALAKDKAKLRAVLLYHVKGKVTAAQAIKPSPPRR